MADSDTAPLPEPQRVEIARDRLAQLRDRADKANLPLKQVQPELDEDYDIEFWELQFPAGRGTRSVYISSTNIDRVLAIEFEKFSFLSEYDAVVSRDDRRIEAPIRALNMSTAVLLNRLLGQRPERDPDPGTIITETKKIFGSNTVTLAIQMASSECSALVIPFLRTAPLSLAISGLDVPTEPVASRYLKTLSNALFVQVDLLYGIPLTLRQRRVGPGVTYRRSAELETKELTFPEHEYEDAPTALFFYGRGARGMPLLQFLAFYQTAEFYFPSCFLASARHRIQLVLKDPSFRLDKDTDVARIVTLAAPASRTGYGDERAQLRATIDQCVDPTELRSFIESVDERKEFLKKKHQGITDVKIPVENADADLREPVGERLYDIRCRIVHTKNSANEKPMILPSSKEAALLRYDVELMQFVATKILVASGVALQLNA